MNFKKRMITGAVFAALAFSIAAFAFAENARRPEKETLVVFLVRHAEKVDSSSDPELSAAGKKRAEELAMVLRDTAIKHIHSSDFIRTRNTAAPLAVRLGLKVDLYDPFDLPALVKRLQETGGRHLVVGHSNTTPDVVELLGGEPGSEIFDNEYDRLYIVTVDANGEASTLQMRFGSNLN